MSLQNIGLRWAAWSPRLLSILRIIAAIMFMSAGTMKLFGFPAFAGMPPIELWSLMGLAGVLETFGGLLLLVGFLARPVAFILAGEMAFAYFIGHAPQGFWPILNQGQPAILYCFIWLYISSRGAGVWSIDAWRAKKKLIA
jgi:putative oxidoreductase